MCTNIDRYLNVLREIKGAATDFMAIQLKYQGFFHEIVTMIQ